MVRILNWIMFAAFTTSVIVQYNDPDPMLWILMYGVAALVCLFYARNSAKRYMTIVVGLFALIWSAMLLPDVWGQVGFLELFESYEMKSMAVEHGREMGGLLIIVAWMVVLTMQLSRYPD